MAVMKLSAIASGTAPATTDTIIGVQSGTTDVQYTLAQVATGVLGTVNLSADASAILALQDGATAESLRIYHDWSSAGAVYSRMEIGFNAHSGIAAIDVAAATSTLPNFGIYVGGALKLDYGITASNRWTFALAAFFAANVGISSGSLVVWGSFGGLTGTADGMITLENNAGTQKFNLTAVGATATPQLQFGAANVNGAPVAQILSFQGALAGSASNQASANTTIIGSLGTGTGTNGDTIFQTGVKTTTGTAQATATTALTIKGETLNAIFANGFTHTPVAIASLPASPVSGQRATVNNGVASPTFLATVSTTGSTVAPVMYNGSNWVYC